MVWEVGVGVEETSDQPNEDRQVAGMGYFDSTNVFVERLGIPDDSEGRMVAADPVVAEAPVWVDSQA